MSENIKITMLGYTNSGKTCFMVGMYAVMQLGVDGFTLSTQDLDEDIDLTDRWDQMIEGGESRFPSATSSSHNYALDLCYGLKPMMSFDWLDYRGGALGDKSSEADGQELRRALVNSFCVFLCVSGEHLREPIQNVSQSLEKGKKTGARRMNQFLRELRKERKGVISVLVTITKYDLCSHRKKEDIAQDIKKLFDPLFTKSDAGDEWLVAICPVSLGKDLAEDQYDGKIEPVNIELPLIFAFYAKLCADTASQISKKHNLNKELNDFQNKSWFMKWLNSKEINQVNDRIHENLIVMNEIQEKMRLLVNRLGNLLLYRNGEETEIGI